MAKTWAAVKDPQEIVDFGVDWSADLGTKTIVASVWSVVSGTIVIDDGTVFDDTTTTVRTSGGTVGETASLLNHITLSNGEEWEQTGNIKVKTK